MRMVRVFLIAIAALLSGMQVAYAQAAAARPVVRPVVRALLGPQAELSEQSLKIYSSLMHLRAKSLEQSLKNYNAPRSAFQESTSIYALEKHELFAPKALL